MRKVIFSFPNECRKQNQLAGFTMIEIVVVVAIFVTITLVTLTSFSTFDSNILVNNLSYDIALSIRKAQTFGINVREAQVGTGDFDQGFGVAFSNGLGNKTYVFFTDTDNDNTYDGGEELLESFSIRGGNTIEKFCGLSSGETETCNTGGSISNLSIVFTRPDPDAVVTSRSPSQSWSGARIYITSRGGIKRTVTVRSTGQISIQGVE